MRVINIWRPVLLGITLTLVACDPGTTGTQGNLQFRDLTETVPPDLTGHVDQPVAVGARLALDVELDNDPGQDADISSAQSDDTAVFDVESYSLGRVVISAAGPGRAFLDVSTSSGISDSIGIGVDEIASSEILLLPWNAWFRLPETLWSNGAVMLPESPVDVFVLHRNDEGTVLTGYGAADWEVSDGATSTVSDTEGSDMATVTSGSDTETFSITTSAGGELNLEVIEETEVAVLSIYNKTDEAGPSDDGETIQLDEGVSYLLHLVAHTTDGEYIIGAGENPLETTIPADDQTVFRIALAPNPSEDSDLNRILNNGRAFTIEALDAGSGSLTVEWAEQSVTVTIEVLGAPDVPEEDEEE